MKNRYKEEAQLIEAINSRYESFRPLSNDALRDAVCTIEQDINASPDVKAATDAYLVEVFALVKETARRFAEGEVVVTANTNDRRLAEIYDFVDINGDKAIYHNQWVAGESQCRWSMVHYDEQLLCGIFLHRGFASEMKTGEGKTLVATLPVFLNALSHRGVHVMTVNDYLSKRDCELTRPIYMFHGLSVDCIEYSESQTKERQRAYKADITFGTESNFAFDYLFDHLAMTPKECVQRRYHHYAIIDELDSILIDDADNPHYIGGGNYYNNEEDYNKYKPIIEELLTVSDKELYTADKLHKKAYFTEEGHKWLSQRCDDEKLFTVTTRSELNRMLHLATEELEKAREQLMVQNILSQLLLAYTIYERDVDYAVISNKVSIIDAHTGRLRENCRWEHGLHTAVEVKENASVDNDFDSMAIISLKNYFKLYEKVCGMTGTAMSVSDELKEVYGLESVVIPTHKPMIRRDEEMRVYRTKADKERAIVKYVSQLHATGHPILVGCKSDKRAEEIYDLLATAGLSCSLLTVKSLLNEAKIIALAGKSNTITVSTSLAGRGTDIKLTPEAAANGGLAIVGTDLFDSERIDNQLKGRAGRQGDPGSSCFFVSLEDPIIQTLQAEELNQLTDEAKQIEGLDISTPNIIALVRKAQQNREDYFANVRKETAMKDDIIAPHRRGFYEQRNKVLFDAAYASELIEGLNLSRDELALSSKNLNKLYHKTCTMLRRYRMNNINLEDEVIPFSDKMTPFAVKFEIKSTFESFDYFRQEFYRQTILHAYDLYWKEFVLHLSENLDSEEVLDLPNRFDQMFGKVKSTIVSRMMHATIPVGGLDSYQEPTVVSIPDLQTVSSKEAVSADANCPCGSGKKYGECHGGNRRNKKPVRR
jgi:preprotein translocase subunit SecA